MAKQNGAVHFMAIRKQREVHAEESHTKMSARDMVTFSNWDSPPAFYTFSKRIGYYEGLTTSNNHSPIDLLPPGSTLREVQKCTYEIA